MKKCIKSAFEAQIMQWFTGSQSYTQVQGCMFTTAFLHNPQVTAFKDGIDILMNDCYPQMISEPQVL